MACGMGAWRDAR